LFTGGSAFDQTPLVPSAMTGKVTKYALVPGSAKNYVANVGYETKFIGTTLTGALQSDRNIVQLGLSAPSGTELGSFSQGEAMPRTENMVPVELRNSGVHSVRIFRDFMEIETHVKSPIENCCECVVKRLTEPGNDVFFYRLKTVVSMSGLNAALTRVKTTVIWLVIAATLLSLVPANILSRMLVRRLELVNSKTREIIRSGDMSLRLNLGEGPDEISQMAAQADRMLDSLEKAQIALVEKGKFEAVANMTQMLAHDVRKPFSILRMGLGILKNAKDPAGINMVLSTLVPEIDKAMSSVDGMISDVMEVGSSSATLIQEPVSPESLIESTLGELFRIYPKSNISISYDFKHSHMTCVHSQKVGRVFSNIVGNAVQAMKYKGSMWFKTQERDGMIEFCLGNAGSVIPAENLSKLFDAFFTSGKKGGTGLGLAIAQKVVTAHGGEIWCESGKTANHPEGQVEFYFTLPIAADRLNKTTAKLPAHSSEITQVIAALTNVAVGPASSVDKGEMTLEEEIIRASSALKRPLQVMVVDDEAIYRNAFVAFLDRTPELLKAIHVVPSENSYQAIKLAANHKFDLIISDVDMGADSLDGFELVKELRHKCGLPPLICIHSNRIVAADHENAVAAGAHAFMPKPMARAQLLRLILQAAQHTENHTSIVSSEGPSSAKPKVLVVDDSSFVLDAWEDSLSDDARIYRADSIEEVEILIASDPDLLNHLAFVITDFKFDNSRSDGLDVAKRLKNLCPCLTIMLSTDGIVSESDLSGSVDHVIAKVPVRLAYLPGVAQRA
jgi:signal transduction histidine kinase/ActR/RegA family two-component response regulator